MCRIGLFRTDTARSLHVVLVLLVAAASASPELDTADIYVEPQTPLKTEEVCGVVVSAVLFVAVVACTVVFVALRVRWTEDGQHPSPAASVPPRTPSTSLAALLASGGTRDDGHHKRHKRHKHHKSRHSEPLHDAGVPTSCGTELSPSDAPPAPTEPSVSDIG